MRCISLFIAALALAGCTASDGGEAPMPVAAAAMPAAQAPGNGPSAAAGIGDPAAADAPGHRYSPFALRLDGHSAFDVVTFKDVSDPLPDPALQIDELMAEAFTIALRGTHPGLLTEVVHEPALLDPSNHVFCDRRHLYVDFWRSPQSPASVRPDGPRWGYSLWSGCGEDDRFAWQEVDGPAAYGLAEQIDRVVDDIARRLSVADARACHQRRC